MNLDFSRELIKNNISKIIFEEMFRTLRTSLLIPIEYTRLTSGNAEWQKLKHIKKVLENISNAPPFCLVSKDNNEVLLIEVKYKNEFNESEIFNEARRIDANWEYAWLFIASKSGFYFSSCKDIIENNGKIEKLSKNRIDNKIQEQYFALMNEFIRF